MTDVKRVHLDREVRQLQDMMHKAQAALNNAQRRAEQLERERNASRDAEATLRGEMGVMRRSLGQADVKATQEARTLGAMTRERDRLLQELAACTQKLAAAAAKAAEQDATAAQNASQLLLMEERLRQAELQLKGAQQEVAMLRANAQEVAGVRREVAALEQELNQERMKSLALGEEVEKPMNVHRWRHLEGADSAAHELLLQTQALQCRLIAMTEANVEKGMQLQERAAMIADLRRQLAARPGQEALSQLSAAQAKAAAQAKQIKALTAELRMLGGKATNHSRVRATTMASAASSDPFAAAAHSSQRTAEQHLLSAEMAGSDVSGRASPWPSNGSAHATTVDVLDLTAEIQQPTPPEQPPQSAVEPEADGGLTIDVAAAAGLQGVDAVEERVQAAMPDSSSERELVVPDVDTAPTAASTAAAADQSAEKEQLPDGMDSDSREAEQLAADAPTQPRSTAEADQGAGSIEPDAAQAVEPAAEDGSPPAQDAAAAEAAEAAADVAESSADSGMDTGARTYSAEDSDSAALYQQGPVGEASAVDASDAVADSGLDEGSSAPASLQSPISDETPSSQLDGVAAAADVTDAAAAVERHEQPVSGPLGEQQEAAAGSAREVAADVPSSPGSQGEGSLVAESDAAALQGNGDTWSDGF